MITDENETDFARRAGLFRAAHRGARFELADGSLYAYDPVTDDLLAALHPDGAGYAPEAVRRFRERQWAGR